LFLDTVPVPTRNVIMACYVASLAMGETLACRSIRSKTLQLYLSNVVKLFLNSGRLDPTKTVMGKVHPAISKVIHEQRRWESMPNRREPLTWEMVADLQSVAKTDPNVDGVYPAMVDWCVLGMYAGLRLSEWAQEDRYSDPTEGYLTNVDGTATAFISSDFTFRTAQKIQVEWTSYIELSTIQYVTIQWRFQKNLDNGESRHFSRHEEGGRCPVIAAHNILLRATRLVVPRTNPIAVFSSGKGRVHFTPSTIDCCLQQSAIRVYKLSTREAIGKFTSHSFRVGACVALHEAGHDDIYIQHRLRWRSNSWKMYLRNTFVLAEQHSQTFLSSH